MYTFIEAPLKFVFESQIQQGIGISNKSAVDSIGPTNQGSIKGVLQNDNNIIGISWMTTRGPG